MQNSLHANMKKIYYQHIQHYSPVVSQHVLIVFTLVLKLLCIFKKLTIWNTANVQIKKVTVINN